MRVTIRALWVLLTFLLLPALDAAAGRRVALVIGNSSYQNAPELRNPRNDAADMAAQLRNIGFELILETDLDKAGMDRAIRKFADALDGAGAALFFYAGHGLQVNGENYLVPVDAKLTATVALDFEMVPLNIIQRSMERQAKNNIIILDACRDNPLARNLARALGTRSASAAKAKELSTNIAVTSTAYIGVIDEDKHGCYTGLLVGVKGSGGKPIIMSSIVASTVSHQKPLFLAIYHEYEGPATTQAGVAAAKATLAEFDKKNP